MHESAIVGNLITTILEESEKLKSVDEVILELGDLTTYKKEAIEFYYDSMKNHYPVLASSVLIINVIPGEVECLDCKKTSIITEKFMIFCPECNSSNVNIIKGRDFVIKDIKEKQNV
ncbi:hydrogenase maturation nickel metallochaperone HypA [Candidatus Pacearchaeota archaeon]|nr:hydrogenase maturation nickel metallochaperone HypA [Candidatus Pacearchaeota archaeon]